MSFLELFRLLLDYSELAEIGYDVPVYATMAIVGTMLFVFRIVVGLFFGIEGLDFDVDLEDHGGEFGVLSVLSASSFLMSAGWVGFFARVAWGFEPLGAGVAAGGTGLLFMFGTAGAMLAMRQLGHEVTWNVETAVGETGQVYMSIPAAGEGRGQVRVTVSGRSMIVDAVSTGDPLAAFSDVRVVEALDDTTLRVESAHRPASEEDSSTQEGPEAQGERDDQD